jgi:hypothetical protein
MRFFKEKKGQHVDINQTSMDTVTRDINQSSEDEMQQN